MITYGFVPAYGDLVTIGKAFTSDNLACVSMIIGVNTGGTGDVVWMNAQGQLQFTPNLQAGQEYIIGAVQIVASGVVNGVSRTTTASSLYWRGEPVYNNP